MAVESRVYQRPKSLFNVAGQKHIRPLPVQHFSNHDFLHVERDAGAGLSPAIHPVFNPRHTLPLKMILIAIVWPRRRMISHVPQNTAVILRVDGRVLTNFTSSSRTRRIAIPTHNAPISSQSDSSLLRRLKQPRMRWTSTRVRRPRR